MPGNHASKDSIVLKMAGSDSSATRKESENMSPIGGKSVAGEAAAGVPVFIFSKTSNSAL